MSEPLQLMPAERIAFTVGLSQVLRGEYPSPNVASVCILAIARLEGQHDWTKDKGLTAEAVAAECPWEPKP